MPNEYTRKGHVSERTDAFAYGVVLIELLIFESYGDEVHPDTFALEARGLVDDQTEDTLGAAILSKAMQGGWAQSVPAARELTEVAIACVKGVSARTTPAQVLGRVEALAHGQREPASQQSW